MHELAGGHESLFGGQPGEGTEACLARAFPDYASLAADGRFARLAQDLFGPFSEWIAGDARAEIHAAEESFDETTSNG